MEAGYKRLEIYKLAHALAVQIHKMSLTLPKHELYEQGSQIRRSSKSVTGQIVEGFALRKYKAEYLHYLYRSYGSCEETVEHLAYLMETGSLDDRTKGSELSEGYNKLSRMLFRFIQSVEQSHDTPSFLKDSAAEYSTLASGNENPEPTIQNLL
ncbi:MAG: four helix bundle protein [Bacteroidota bacterium]